MLQDILEEIRPATCYIAFHYKHSCLCAYLLSERAGLTLGPPSHGTRANPKRTFHGVSCAERKLSGGRDQLPR